MNTILVNEFVKGLLVFLRIAGVIFTAPIFNSRVIPWVPKFLLILILTYIIFFTVPHFNYNINQGLITLGLIGIKEVITGMIIGFAFNFVFIGLSYAGTLIGFDMGLAIAQVFDPNTEANTNMVGQFLSFSGILIFLIINGHQYIIQSIAYTFKIIPIGLYTINKPVFELLIKYSATIFIIGIKISAPLIVSFFLLYVAAGIISRVVPQMQVFFVIQPLQIIMGFLLLAAVMPLYVLIIKNLLADYENQLLILIKAMS